MEVPDLKIRVVTSPEDVEPFWQWLTHPRGGMVAVDIETGAGTENGNPLEWWKPGCHVRMVQYGNALGGWAVPFSDWPRLVEESFKWIARSRTKHVWHNGFDYDSKVLKFCHGINLDITTLEDTFVWAGLCGYAGDFRGLKTVAEDLLGPWAAQGQDALKTGMKNGGWNWTTVPMGWQPYPVYGVMDVCETALIWEHWEHERKLYQPQHELEIAVSEYTNAMSINGMMADGAYIQTKYREWKQRADLLAAKCQEMGATPNQNDVIRKILLEADALDQSRLTEGGVVRVDKLNLQYAKDKHPLAALVLEAKSALIVADRYLGKLWDLCGNQPVPTIIHPSINSMEARTHRMSVSDPAAQQFPASDPTVRNAIIPRNPGEVLVTADFGQIEVRGWASATKDQAMLDDINLADRTGGDFFDLMGRRITHEPDFNRRTDPRGKQYKNTTYATLYDASPGKIAEMTGMPLDDVQHTLSEMRAVYPSFRDAGRSMIEDLGGGEAQIVLPSGRVFRVRNWGDQRKLPNYRVQGWAAEVFKTAVVRCGAAGMGPNMVIPVHDELVNSVKANEAEDFAAELKIIMDSVVDPEIYGVAVTATPVIGKRWGALKD